MLAAFTPAPVQQIGDSVNRQHDKTKGRDERRQAGKSGTCQDVISFHFPLLSQQLPESEMALDPRI